MDDATRREEAIKRIKQRRDFGSHLLVYVLVNGLLVVIWALTNSGGYFWPVWPMAGWGIGLVMHAWETFGPGISESAIDKEMRKDNW